LDSSSQQQLQRLNLLKMLLCHLKLGQIEAARTYQKQLPLLPEDPVHYLAEAAFLFEFGQREPAYQLVHSIRWVYPIKTSSMFLESFYALSYLNEESQRTPPLSIKTPQIQAFEYTWDYTLIPEPLVDEVDVTEILPQDPSAQ